MKKQNFRLMLAFLILLSLSACAEKQTKNALEPYSTGWDGRVYTVTPIDNDKGTISDGTNTYSYRYDVGGSVTFTYPDGETYKWSDNGTGAVSLGFDFEKYPDGWTLKRVLESAPSKQQEKAKSAKNWGLILLFLLIGGANTVWPQAAWYLETGWKIKDAEPSELALGVNRASGILLLLIAGVMLLT